MALGKHIFYALVGTSPLWLSILFLLYGPSYFAIQPNFELGFKPLKTDVRRSAETRSNMDEFDWKTADMTKLDVPDEIKEAAINIEIQEKTIKIGNIEVFYREAIPTGPVNPDLNLFLLHGMAFTSKTWQDLGTLQLLAAMGYKTVAADIPGYGNSPKNSIPDDFVHKLSTELGLIRPVVISPSLSGYYTQPYLVSHWQQMGGYVPVAPQGWEVLESQKSCSDGKGNISNVPDTLKAKLPRVIPDLSCIKVPTLVVFGEHDRARNSALLCLLPWSQPAEIPDGKHPAYMSNPNLWHKLLFNFLGYVSENISVK